MDLGPNESQQILKRNARDFLEQVCPTSHVRAMEEDATGFDPAIWKQVSGFGWAGLLIPEHYGGSGGSITDMAVLFEEIGRAMLPGPLFASGVFAALTILAAGTEEQKRALLPALADGNRIYSLALVEPTGTYEPWGIETRATRSGDGWEITGTKMYVHNANVADTLIVAARTSPGDGPEGITLFLVDPAAAGVKRTILDTIAQDHQYEITFSGTPVAADHVLGVVDGGWAPLQQAMDRAAVVKAAESVGGADRCLEIALDYSKKRVQFGRPIGAFQSLQYRMVKMLTEVVGAQLVVYEAAYHLDQGEDAQLDVSLAKAAASQTYTMCSDEGCHIMGGAGFIRESDMQLYFRRAKGAEVELGDPRWHNARVAAVLEAMPAPAAH